MSHVLKQQQAHHPDLQRVLDAQGGDAEAALVACLLDIDLLAAKHEQVSAATSYGYARGSARRPAAAAAAPAPNTKPLDLQEEGMEPVQHVVKEVQDRADRCVASEVVTTYEEGDRESFKEAAAEAKEMQAAYDEDPDVPPCVTYSVTMW